MRLLLFSFIALSATSACFALSATGDNSQLSDSGQPLDQRPVLGNPDIDGLAEEAEAMGGEEFPTIPVGKLHGDWLFVAIDHSFEPLFATQIIHEKGATTANGDVAIRAKGWNLGQTTGHESFAVVLNGDVMNFTAQLSNQTLNGELKWDGKFWRGWMQYGDQNSDLMSVALISPYELDSGIETFFPPLLAARFMAVDERGQLITTPTQWDVIQGDAQDGMVVETNQGEYNPGAIKADPYFIVASSVDLSGNTRINHISIGQQASQDYYLVLRPRDEGVNLPIEVAFFCSPGEDCRMQAKDIPINFTLPVGWGAEMPLKAGAEYVMFNMVKMTPQGPFWVTLNQPQRMAELGPCREIVWGTLCHDNTTDSSLLKAFEVIAESLSIEGEHLPVHD